MHRQVEAGVEEEGFEQRGGDFALERGVAFVVAEDDLGFFLQVLVFFGPAERVVDLGCGRERHKYRGVTFRVHGFHEGNVGEHSFFMRCQGVGNQRHRTDGSLNGIEHGQPREHPHGCFLFEGVEGVPAFDVVGQRHFFGEPEVSGESVPDLKVFFVWNGIPVNGADGAVARFGMAFAMRRGCSSELFCRHSLCLLVCKTFNPPHYHHFLP